ncbi:MAG: hypothetical protein ACYDCH_12635, partial [Gaiellaceae bacterium]
MAARLAGPVTGAATFALSTAVAFDAGGFHPVTWDRALVALAAAGLVLAIVCGVERPAGWAALLVAALAGLTAWTALSWLWSDSPPAALEEAQRVALYLAAAAVVAAAGRRAPLGWILGGVAASAAFVCAWDLATRLAPDWSGQTPTLVDIGGLADPIGYANGVALVAAFGLVLALATPRAAPLLVPFAAVLALQQSTGADAAALLGVAACVLAGPAPVTAGLRVLATVALPAVGAVLVARDDAVFFPPHADLHAAAGPGHRLGLALSALALAQVGVARAVASIRSREAPARALKGAAVALALAVLVAAPFAVRGPQRGPYWR